MSAINSVVLVGRLTRDPELKFAPSGTAICSFSLAVDRAGDSDGEGGYSAGFFDVNVFGKSAEACAQYLAKGSQAGVSGRLSFHRWESDTGQKRSKVEVRALDVQFLGSPKDRENGDRYTPAAETATSVSGAGDFGDGDADIPFAFLDKYNSPERGCAYRATPGLHMRRM